MGTTAKGYRYPNAADAVANTHTFIQRLAEDVDDRQSREVRTFTDAATTDGTGTATLDLPAGVNAGAPTFVSVMVTGSSSRSVVVSAFGSTTVTVHVRDLATGSTVNNTALTFRVLAAWA